MSFTAAERDYLEHQRLGRIGTCSASGVPDVAPVGFQLRDSTIEVGGIDLAKTRKFVNIRAGGLASFVVDDLASVDPWRPRGVKITGPADIGPDQGDSATVIRLTAATIWSWGINQGAELHHAGMIEKRVIDQQRMSRHQVPAPTTGITTTHFVVADDVTATADFYARVLGGRIVFEADGAPTFVKLANSWVIVNEGGGPTPDKPDVTLETPTDPTRVSAFMNIRVADINAVYRDWTERGAEFVTEPIDNHGYEIRCYLQDPDGRIIEVGQPTGMLDLFDIAQ